MKERSSLIIMKGKFGNQITVEKENIQMNKNNNL